jgi:signal transduction histidine kinase
VAAASPQPTASRESDEYASLLVTAALSHAELDATLARLTALLAILPVGIWLLAATVGQALVRRSLRPLTAMADQARSTTGPDFEMRLPTGTARDELYDMAAAFNRLLDQLQQAFEGQRHFSAGAAHQLRTPLTVLQGELDVVLRRPRSEDEYRQCLAKLAAVVHEMHQIVESLLLLARTDNAMCPQIEPLELSVWLPHYARRWQHHPRWSDLSIRVVGSPYVLASVPLLTQLLDNLIQNAVYYSPAGTPVLVKAEAVAETVKLAVVDQGMGIPEHERSAIFEPFVRTSRARQSGVEGTGLGLAVAQRIAHAMGGKLECHSGTDNGKGTVFLLSLPSQIQLQVGNPQA